MGRLSQVLVGLVAAGCFVLAGSSLRAQKTEEKAGEKTGHDVHAGPYEQCAKACTDCLRACESCALHCAKLVSEGKKEHMRTLGTCLDCSEFCAAAARITSHHGPTSSLICEACARACDLCGKECEKYKDDQPMQQCARACRDCAQVCREMIRHTGGHDREGKTEKKGE